MSDWGVVYGDVLMTIGQIEDNHTPAQQELLRDVVYRIKEAKSAIARRYRNKEEYKGQLFWYVMTSDNVIMSNIVEEYEKFFKEWLD